MTPTVIITDAYQDAVVRKFLDGLGIKVKSCEPKDRYGYSHYHGAALGYELWVRVADKKMQMGQRIIYMEMIYDNRIFQVIGLDSMNVFAPTKEHIENMQIGLAKIVYDK